jgi:hypothetical protein
VTYTGTTARTPGGAIEISVLRAGVAQPLHRAPGGGLFTAGAPGQPYVLRVRNLTPGRVEVITTVDGRNTLKDEPGDPHACAGMVIYGNDTYMFKGWRVDDQQTRQFVFGDPGSSVAARATGSADNVGVIGFAAWRERWKPTAYAAYATNAIGGASYSVASAGAPMGSAAAAGPVTRSLGTGIGERQHDPVGRTDFPRAAGEPEILVVGYDTADALAAMGIIGPQAFPGAVTGYEKYATS